MQKIGSKDVEITAIPGPAPDATYDLPELFVFALSTKRSEFLTPYIRAIKDGKLEMEPSTQAEVARLVRDMIHDRTNQRFRMDAMDTALHDATEVIDDLLDEIGDIQARLLDLKGELVV